VAPLPQVDFPTIQVTAQLPGTSPETMASSVATPLERQFAQISNVSQLTSVSAASARRRSRSSSTCRVTSDAAAQDVQAAINAAAGQLPKNLPSPPTYRKTNPADAPVLILVLRSQTLPLSVVSDYADNVLAQQISQLDGWRWCRSRVQAGVRVEANPAALAGRAVSLEDVRAAIAAATLKRAQGHAHRDAASVHDREQRPALQGRGLCAARHRLAQRLAGAALRRREVVDGVEEPAGPPTYDGRPSIVLIIQRQPAPTSIETVERIKPHYRVCRPRSHPQSTCASPPIAPRRIRASVADVQFTLVLTVGLVVLAIFLFLRNLWATLIPAVTVPLSLIGTAAIMYLLGYSLDNLSLMALTIAAGFVVDDAIVMVEKRRAPPRAWQDATRRGPGGCEGDRLHDRVDQRLPRRRVHPDFSDGRADRAAVRESP